jgi:hypothetical protein
MENRTVGVSQPGRTVRVSDYETFGGARMSRAALVDGTPADALMVILGL